MPYHSLCVAPGPDAECIIGIFMQVAAALENPNLTDVVNRCLSSSME